MNVIADSVSPVDHRATPPREPGLDQERLTLAKRFLLPTQVLLVFIVAFPLCMQAYVSLTGWTPLDGRPWYEAYRFWLWFDNFTYLFTDSGLWQSIWRTIIFVAICVPIEFALGLFLAVLFYEGIFGKSVLYSVVLMPMMVVPAVAGYIFFLVFQQEGPFNMLWSGLTGANGDINWLNHTFRAFVAVVIADVWQWTPLMFLLLYAGLMAVPEDQMRAARILGAGWWPRFRYIALPRMKKVIVIAVALRCIECFKIFDMLFVMTSGGPGVATESLSLHIYKLTFQNLEWSYVAAIGLVILILLSVVAGMIIARSGRSDTPEAQEKGAG